MINPEKADEISDKLVFLYSHFYDCPQLADEEYGEQLIFEVPANATSFTYTNDELKNANAWYRKNCECNNVDAQAVVQGTINGEKLSAGTWRIQTNVSIPSMYKDISFNRTFTLQ